MTVFPDSVKRRALISRLEEVSKSITDQLGEVEKSLIKSVRASNLSQRDLVIALLEGGRMTRNQLFKFMSHAPNCPTNPDHLSALLYKMKTSDRTINSKNGGWFLL